MGEETALLMSRLQEDLFHFLYALSQVLSTLFFFFFYSVESGIYITHSPKLRIIFQIFHSLDPDAYFLSSDPGIERFETALSKEIKISKK